MTVRWIAVLMLSVAALLPTLAAAQEPPFPSPGPQPQPRPAPPRPTVELPSGNQTVPLALERIGGPVRVQDIPGHQGQEADIDVVVVDSGVDADHPDLNVVGGFDCMTGRAYNTTDNRPADDLGHGTQVAGIIAARDNDQGVVGVVPGARIWAVRVGSQSIAPTNETMHCALNWILERADMVEVVNMSVGFVVPNLKKWPSDCGDTVPDDFRDSICEAVERGVVFVVAAGNEENNTIVDTTYFWPAMYDSVIAVSAMTDYDGVPDGIAGFGVLRQLAKCPVSLVLNQWGTFRGDLDDTFAYYSNYGFGIDVIAPGTCVLTTSPGNKYESPSGTSFAAPYVAGAAAAYLLRHEAASPSEVTCALVNTAERGWNVDRNQPGGDDPDGREDPLVNVRQIIEADPLRLDARLEKIPEPVIAAPGESITVEVTMRNQGGTPWIAGSMYGIRRVGGVQLGPSDSARITQTIPSGGAIALRMRATAPRSLGPHESVWQMTCHGYQFGPRISIPVFVTPGGSTTDFGIQLRSWAEQEWQRINQMFEDAGRQVTDAVNDAVEAAQRRAEEMIRQEIERQARDLLRNLCGVAPAMVLAGAGTAFWRTRQRRSSTAQRREE